MIPPITESNAILYYGEFSIDILLKDTLVKIERKLSKRVGSLTSVLFVKGVEWILNASLH